MLDKFELQDIWHILQPQAINQEKTNKLLERIAVALERANSLEHVLTQDELDFLCKKKVVKKRKPRRSKGEIKGEITRKYIKKLNKGIKKNADT
jgi:hypothetical protein|tara:strand:- start:179 stop:460 length:282 start_codon:yes stop_codon:yes gene_type:complete